MTITQTVEIPADRRITLDLPAELPIGRAKVTVVPETEKPALKENSKLPTPITDSLVGILASAGDVSLEQIREERLAKYLK